MALAQSSLKTSRVCAGRPAGTFSAPRPALQRRTLICRAEPVVAGPVTDETFETLVLKSKVPVLIDFWAPWCGPCRMIAPLIDEIAGEYQGKLTCYKLNTDESPGVATEYGIRSIPTVMIFKNGQKMETIIGAVPKVTLIQSVEKFLTVTSA